MAKKKSAKKTTKKAAARKPGTLFVQSPLSARDTIICEISRIAQAVFSSDHNKNPLYMASLGELSRRRVVAQYAEVIQAARAAGWDIVVLKTSLFDDIDL